MDEVTDRSSLGDLLAGLQSRLEERLRKEPGGLTTAGEILGALGDRSHWLMMLLLALPNLVPVPLVPGSTTLTGVPLALIALAAALGRRSTWLPDRWLHKSLPLATCIQWVSTARRHFGRIESYVHPRWPILSSDPSRRLCGTMIVVLAVVLSLPIPLGNLMPALSIALLCIGTLERDGLFVLAGFVMALVSLSVVALLGELATLGLALAV